MPTSFLDRHYPNPQIPKFSTTKCVFCKITPENWRYKIKIQTCTQTEVSALCLSQIFGGIPFISEGQMDEVSDFKCGTQLWFIKYHHTSSMKRKLHNRGLWPHPRIYGSAYYICCGSVCKKTQLTCINNCNRLNCASKTTEIRTVNYVLEHTNIATIHSSDICCFQCVIYESITLHCI